MFLQETSMISPEKNFDTYKNECLEDLMVLQPEFMKLYDINSYENWYYDHGIGAFHFKSDSGKSLYFKYVDVGSFSTKSNTWQWSWNNEYTPVLVSKALKKVRGFGQANNYNELLEGLFDGDEHTGWALTAVAAKLLNALGAYRVPHEHLFIYFIFTNELTQEEYDALEDKYIECDTHQSARVAFICQHLDKDKLTGFHEAFDSDEEADDDDEYQAWCNECEKVREQEDEWNEKSMAFAQIKPVCEHCYFEIKEKNQSG